MAVNIQMANTSFEVFNNDPSLSSFEQQSPSSSSSSSDGKKAASALENAFSVFRRSSSSKSDAEETAKKTLFGKILKILSLKASESKTNEKSRKHYRQRRRSSATPSHFEPMPTIYEEENESEFYCGGAGSFSYQQQSAIIAVA